MNKKLLSLIICILSIISLSGCAKINKIIQVLSKDDVVEVQSSNDQNSQVVVEEQELKPNNVIDKTTSKPQRIDINDQSLNTSSKDVGSTLPNDGKITINIDGESKTRTYGEIISLIDKTLQEYQLNEYKVNEDLIFNYTNTTATKVKSITLTDETEEIRQDNQYYYDNKRHNKDALNRTIKAIKYKDRANNLVYVADFNTVEEDKNVNLEWVEPEDDTEYLPYLKDKKVLKIPGLKEFYEFESVNDFKAKGTMNLRQWLELVHVSNAGTKTLKDVQAEMPEEIIEEGVRTEKIYTYRPLEFEFDYTLTKKEDIITIEANLFNVLTDYYKFFANYTVEKCTYKLVVEDISDEKGDFLNEDFKKQPEKDEVSTPSDVATESDITE